MTDVIDRVEQVVGPTHPRVVEIKRIDPETPDTATYWLDFVDPAEWRGYSFHPGQFNMLYRFGSGEVPISISSAPDARPIAHTIRWVGRVTNSLRKLEVGDQLLIRGPFGKPWPVAEAHERDLLVVAGGLGLAPVRPAIYHALGYRERFRRLIVIVGARAPEHMLYLHELSSWTSHFTDEIELHLTVDLPDDAWPYHEGVVTRLFDSAMIDPASTTAFICGPEIMMRLSAAGLEDLGVSGHDIHLSLERNMHCGERVCGHCQFGSHLVCSDGPVFRYTEVRDDMRYAEL